MKDPLKQGLKQRSIYKQKKIKPVEVKDPLKQGLKLFSWAIREASNAS